MGTKRQDMRRNQRTARQIGGADADRKQHPARRGAARGGKRMGMAGEKRDARKARRQARKRTERLAAYGIPGE